MTPWWAIDARGTGVVGDLILTSWIYIWALVWVVGVFVAAYGQAYDRVEKELTPKKGPEEYGVHELESGSGWRWGVAAVAGPFWPLIVAVAFCVVVQQSLVRVFAGMAHRRFLTTPEGQAAEYRLLAKYLREHAKHMDTELAEDTRAHARRIDAEAAELVKK